MGYEYDYVFDWQQLVKNLPYVLRKSILTVNKKSSIKLNFIEKN